MPHVTTDAQTERVSGAYGTSEFHAKGVTTTPYRSSSPPSARLAGTSITSTPPSDEAIRRRALLELQQISNAPRVINKTRGSAQWAELVGYNRRDDTYGIKVKIRGISPETYWLSFSKAASLWYEVTGTAFEDVAYYA